MPNINIMIAMALMACITFRLKLVGRLGSFFLKKYIYKYMGKKVKGKSRKMLMLNIKYRTFKISDIRHSKPGVGYSYPPASVIELSVINKKRPPVTGRPLIFS